jgi:hypothetical protein
VQEAEAPRTYAETSKLSEMRRSWKPCLADIRELGRPPVYSTLPTPKLLFRIVSNLYRSQVRIPPAQQLGSEHAGLLFFASIPHALKCLVVDRLSKFRIHRTTILYMTSWLCS